MVLRVGHIPNWHHGVVIGWIAQLKRIGVSLVGESLSKGIIYQCGICHEHMFISE